MTDIVETQPEDQPLPAGVFHLLIADSDVANAHWGYVALCGDVITTSGLPPSCYPEVGPGPDPRYCPACVRGALRFSAEAGQSDRGGAW